MSIALSERPNIWPWPPMLFVICALAAFLLSFAMPLPVPGFLGGSAGRLAGLAIIACGFCLDVWAMVTMHRQDTNILPNKAADRLVQAGPFAHSRNPIYLGNVIMLAGGTLAFGTLWCLAAALANAAAVQYLAIVREEAHMAARFGDEWARYAGQVRRWF